MTHHCNNCMGVVDDEGTVLCGECTAEAWPDEAAIRADERAKVEAEVAEVIEAARCIRHWHDAMGGEGMVVSADHVRWLWEALSRLDTKRGAHRAKGGAT